MKIQMKAAWSKYKVEKGGIYSVFEEIDTGYVIDCSEKLNGKLTIPKKFAKVIIPEKFNLKAFALTIKYLEETWHKMYLKEAPLNREPIEFYYVNELQYNSAFCQTFRKHKVKVDGKKYCLCPLSIWRNKNYDSTFEDGTVSCRKFKGKVLSDKALYKRAKKVKVETVIKFLKKIKISKTLIGTFKPLYYQFVKLKID